MLPPFKEPARGTYLLRYRLLQGCQMHQQPAEAVVAFTAIQAGALGSTRHNHGVVAQVAVHSSRTDESNREAVVRFLSRIGCCPT